MKRVTTSSPLPPDDIEAVRQELRDFAVFLDAQDPEALAAGVTQIADTLHRAARIQSFFRRYVAALKKRVVH